MPSPDGIGGADTARKKGSSAGTGETRLPQPASTQAPAAKQTGTARPIPVPKRMSDIVLSSFTDSS